MAVKITPTSVVRSACKEVTALTRLHNAHIVQLLGVQVDMHEEKVYMVMELCQVRAGQSPAVYGPSSAVAVAHRASTALTVHATLHRGGGTCPVTSKHTHRPHLRLSSCAPLVLLPCHAA